VTLRLPASHSAPAAARRKLRTTCVDLEQGVIDDAELLLSELVTNAVKATAAIITVAIECDDSSIAVAVSDDSPDPPVLQHSADQGSNGRGLQIVDRLARTWGWRPTSDIGGKVVWFRMERRRRLVRR